LPLTSGFFAHMVFATAAEYGRNMERISWARPVLEESGPTLGAQGRDEPLNSKQLVETRNEVLNSGTGLLGMGNCTYVRRALNHIFITLWNVVDPYLFHGCHGTVPFDYRKSLWAAFSLFKQFTLCFLITWVFAVDSLQNRCYFVTNSKRIRVFFLPLSSQTITLD